MFCQVIKNGINFSCLKRLLVEPGSGGVEERQQDWIFFSLCAEIRAVEMRFSAKDNMMRWRIEFLLRRVWDDLNTLTKGNMPLLATEVAWDPMSPDTIHWQASSILTQLYICNRTLKRRKSEGNIRFQITNQDRRKSRAYICVHSSSEELPFVPSNGNECLLEWIHEFE